MRSLVLALLGFLALQHLALAELLQPLGDRLADLAHDEPAAAHRVVVARDDDLDVIRVAVGVDDRDDRDVQLVGLGDRDALLLAVDHEDRSGKPLHVGHAREVVLEALEVVLRVVGLLAAHPLEVALRLHDAQLGEAAQAALDDREVGEHPAHPTMGDVGLPGVAADLLDDVLGLLLGTDEEDLLAAPDDISQVFAGDVELLLGLLEVDDVDAVARREDVRAHTGVPAAGLVAEVNSGLQQLTQCYCRHGRSLLLGWCGASVRGEPRRRPGGTGHPPAA